jgi:hypothetical protein
LNGQYSGVESTGTSGAIYSIGGGYVPGTTNLGNMYGIGYGYSGNAGITATGAPASKWGMYVAAAGVSRIFLDATNGNIYANGGLYDTGNRVCSNTSGCNGLTFSIANPYINASSYFVAPGGAYFSSGTVYFAAALQARGGVHNDNAAYLSITGGTSGVTYFSGNVGIGTTGPGYKLDVVGNINGSTGVYDAGNRVYSASNPPPVGTYETSCSADSNGRLHCCRINKDNGDTVCKTAANHGAAWTQYTYQPFTATTQAKYSISCHAYLSNPLVCVRTNMNTGVTESKYAPYSGGNVTSAWVAAPNPF